MISRKKIAIYDDNDIGIVLWDQNSTAIDGNKTGYLFLFADEDTRKPKTLEDITQRSKAEEIKNSIMKCLRGDISESEIKKGDSCKSSVLIESVEYGPDNNRGVLMTIFQQNKDFLQKFVQNSSDFIYRMKIPDGVYEYISPAIYRMLGYTAEEYYTKTIQLIDTIHPDSLEYFHEIRKGLMNNVREPSYEFQVITKDGRHIWVNQRNVFEVDEQGNTVAIEGVVTDITEKKISELRLAESEKKYRQLFNISQEGICAIDDNEIITLANNSLCEMLGYSQDEVVGKNIASFLDESGLELAINNIEKAKKGKSEQFELNLIDINGNKVNTIISAAPIFNDQGEYIGSLGSFIDITSMKSYENKLMESEIKYRRLFNLAQEGIWVIDDNSNTVLVNNSLASMLGYTIEEMMGRHIFSFMDQKGKDITLKNLERRKSGIKEMHDFKFIKKDGTQIVTTLATAPITDEFGTYIGAIAGVIDITEQRNLQKQVMHMQKMEALGRLVGGVAHDFHNNLYTIELYANIIEGQNKNNQELIKNLQQINEAAKRSLTLTDQLLTFSKKKKTKIETCDVNSVISSIKEMIKQTIPRSILLQTTFSDKKLPVKVNKELLQQACINLIMNAVDAMPDKGKLDLKINEKILDEEQPVLYKNIPRGTYASISITDNGIGISPKIIDKIFDPFFTTKDHEVGTGLGLSMVYGVIEKFGGYINVISAPDSGSQFIIYLPLAVA